MKRRSDDLGQPPWQIISKLHDKNNKLKSADTDLGMCLQVLYHDCCYYFSIIISRASLVSDCKVSACNVGDLGSIPGLGRSPGEQRGYPLQYSCLENSMDRAAWQVRVHGVSKGRTRLSDWQTHTIISFNLPYKSMKSYYLSNSVIGPVLMDLILLWGYRQETRKSIHLEVC